MKSYFLNSAFLVFLTFTIPACDFLTKTQPPKPVDSFTAAAVEIQRSETQPQNQSRSVANDGRADEFFDLTVPIDVDTINERQATSPTQDNTVRDRQNPNNLHRSNFAPLQKVIFQSRFDGFLQVRFTMFHILSLYMSVWLLSCSQTRCFLKTSHTPAYMALTGLN